MKILTIGNDYFSVVFREMGHDVLVLPGWRRLKKPIFPSELTTLLKSKDFHPDVVLWCDDSDMPNVFGWETLDAVTIGFSIDLYCNPWHVPYSTVFDHFFVAQKDFIPIAKKNSLLRVMEWFPLFCRRSDTEDLGLNRDIPVSFVGTVEHQNNPDRKLFFDGLCKKIPIYVTQGPYKTIFGRSQIVVNQSAVGEINFRTFEACACGAAVLTEDVGHGLHELFSIGKEIIVYPRGNYDEAARIAKCYLESQDVLQEIAKYGRKRVIYDHTVELRTGHVVRTAAEMIQNNAQQWRLNNIESVHYELEKSFYFISNELDAARHNAMKNFFHNMAMVYSKNWKKMRMI